LQMRPSPDHPGLGQGERGEHSYQVQGDKPGQPGVAAALALRARGGEVAGCDAGAVTEDVRARLVAAGVAVRAPSEGVDLLARASTVVKSPGVPQEAPVVATARRQGTRIVGELEIGWRLVPNEFVAVTGSNGKTTTVELIGHVHRTAGWPVVVAGNVGTALTTLPGTLAGDETVVCEASSFQLEDTEAFAPEAAVLLNIAEDHLDRYGSMEAYRAAKLQVFARQPPGTIAVAPAELAAGLAAHGRARRVTFGRGGAPLDFDERGTGPVDLHERDAGPADVEERGGRLWWRGEPLMGASEIRLRGAHNRENAMAAAAVCLARGLPPESVRAGLASFTGIPHRLEEVGTAGGVLYVNDSKATNVASAVVGIESFEGGVHAILGGRGKRGDYSPLARPVAERCRGAYLIGETAAEIHEALAPTGVALHDCQDLERAVAAARSEARPGDTVLLSPACASYDQYASFEERGEHFRALVTAG
ncbi:MAG: UDP-N-acetylmuramoyl-L-alanine--D-glutamate ligase, partial [Solirubrobacteraceae bacterium]